MINYEHMGKQGKDSITGFKGTVIGYTRYISGCNQVLLSPKVNSDGRLEDSIWIDEQRIKFTGIPISLDNEKGSGADISAPIRQAKGRIH